MHHARKKNSTATTAENFLKYGQYGGKAF
jgi:hypothetical protein